MFYEMYVEKCLWACIFVVNMTNNGRFCVLLFRYLSYALEWLWSKSDSIWQE